MAATPAPPADASSPKKDATTEATAARRQFQRLTFQFVAAVAMSFFAWQVRAGDAERG